MIWLQSLLLMVAVAITLGCADESVGVVESSSEYVACAHWFGNWALAKIELTFFRGPFDSLADSLAQGDTWGSEPVRTGRILTDF